MEESRFYKNIWRFNAVVIAVVGILSTIALIFVIGFIYKQATRDQHKAVIVNVDPESEIVEKIRFGLIENIIGSKSVIVPIFSDQSFSVNYSSGKSTVSTRNLLFIDMENQESRWLLPTNDFLITKRSLLNERNMYYDREAKVEVIIYYIVKSDTNGDRRLTESDKITISITDANGKNYTELIDNVDDVLGTHMVGKEELSVIFNRDGKGYCAQIELASFEVKGEKELPKINRKL